MTSPDPSPANRDSSPSAPAGEPLRSVHTASFAVLLEQLGISLLVSTYQAGKVVVLRSEHGVLNTHFCGFNKPMGMALSEDRLAVATARLWVLNSGEGQIGYVSLNGAQGEDATPPTELVSVDQGFCTTGVVQRPQNHRDKLGGVCAILSRARFNNSYQPLAALPGFTRGLDFCGRYAFVGLSQVRESAVFSGIQIAERPQAERFCGVWVIDIVTGEIVAWVQFQDALQEIFAVCVVPHRTWPEITNSNIGLISNSFVLPEEVLDTVPSELLKRVPVVTGDQPERASARLAKTRAQKTHPTKTSPRFSERMVIACHSSSGSRH